MSDTPRTDAATWQTRTPGDPMGASVVYWSFAEGLERELTAAQAEIARLKAGGCARDQRTTQFCGEALKLQEENARLNKELTETKAHNARLIESSMAAWARVDDGGQQ